MDYANGGIREDTSIFLFYKANIGTIYEWLVLRKLFYCCPVKLL